jgi:O-antigen/teichoic acid export membrane protein
LTFSTAGYVISLIIFLFAYCKRHRTIFSRILPFIFLALVAGSIIFWKPLASFLSQLAPTLFGKLDSNNASFTTRIYSWLYGLKVFITNPLFGYGGQTARDLYFDLIQKDGISIDAFTSTFGYLAASFGILGILIYLLPIFGLIFAKDCSWPSKFFLFVIYIFVSNQENQATLYFAQIIYFYFALYGKRVFKFFNDQKPAENEDSKKRLLDIFLRKDHSGVVASNVAAIGVLKVASILLGIITIPTYLAFFGEDNTSYGAWLTIISVLNWILTFDFGFGNSLRNKLSEALSKRQMPLVKSYISSAYVISGILSLIWIVGLSIAIPLLDLNTVLGISTSIISSSALKLTIFLLFIGIALELTLKNIMYILDVMGKNAISSSLPFISNLLLLLAAVIVHAEGDQRFVVLAAIYCGAVLLPYFVPTFYIFIKKKMPSPSVRSLSKVAAKGIFSMGIGFFIVQCSNLFLGSLNELLITKIMGNPAYVLEYTEYYKIFGAFWSLGTVIQSTIWVSISKADALQNLSSIKKDIKFSLFFFSGIFLLCIVAGVSLPLIFPIWLGNDSPGVNWIYVLVFILYSFVYVAAEFVILICNGFGLVKQQAIIAGVAMVLKIPLCLLLSLLFKDQLRWSIVILANAILLLPYLPVCWILIKKRLRGMEAAKNAKIQESKKTD